MGINALSPVSFRVDTHQDVYQYQTTKSKVARVAYLIFSIIFFPVGIVRLTGRLLNYYFTTRHLMPALIMHKKEELDQLRNSFLSMPGRSERSQRMIMERADGIKIDTFSIKHPEEKVKPPQEQKWIIYLNGNKMVYEKNLNHLLAFSDGLKVNVLSCNYSGVGHSEGRSSEIRDCAMDGETLMQYLLSLGVQRNHIVIYGWSWGGAVGAEVASNHQQEHESDTRGSVSFVSDRSFVSLPKLIKTIAYYKIRFLFLARLFGAIGAWLSKALGWGFNSYHKYRDLKGKKFVIYSKADLIVPYKASLYKCLKKIENKRLMNSWTHRQKCTDFWKPKRLKITEIFEEKRDFHSKEINDMKHFDEFKNHVQEIFGRS